MCNADGMIVSHIVYIVECEVYLKVCAECCSDVQQRLCYDSVNDVLIDRILH